jgi:peptidase M1-like protein
LLRATLPLLLLALAAPASAALPERAPEVVDYDIKVRLDSNEKRLAGSERIVWRNPSQDTVPDLWLHLYLNAFKSTRTTFYRESGGRLRRDDMPEDAWGYTDVTSLKLADGTDLLKSMTYEQPDDGNGDDQTVARVLLPQPVPPGGSVTLDLEWKAQLPQVFARTGYKRDFFMVGQWFPKLGVYEPAGLRGRAAGGWNCHQFHANSEFYADYGRFRVEITVPSRFVVGATGPRVETRPGSDGTTTYVHEQRDVHDFAWTADPRFIEVKDTFSADRDVTPAEYEAAARLVDRPLAEVKLRDVAITLLIQPGHLPQARRHIVAAKNGLKHFGLWYGRYPYPTLTVVDPAPGAMGAGGMEYPTLITAGSSFVFNRWPFDRIRLPEEVTIHEFGHQFWYGMVGSNEFEESWLDEGFNTYSTHKVDAASYPAMIELFGFRFFAHEEDRLGNGLERRFDRIRTPSWGFSPGQYGFNSYGRPGLALGTLEAMLGEATMARVMRTYHERFRFGHPSSDDFYAVASEVAGRDLRDFFRQVIESPGVLDDAVTEVDSARLSPDRGVLEGPEGRKTVTARDAEKAEEDGALYRSTVQLRRLGEVSLPVEVTLRFDGGAPPEKRIFEPGARWARWRYERKERIVSAEIAPRPLDLDRLNDSRRVEPDRRAATRWSASLLFFVQQAIAFLGM